MLTRIMPAKTEDGKEGFILIEETFLTTEQFIEYLNKWEVTNESAADSSAASK